MNSKKWQYKFLSHQGPVDELEVKLIPYLNSGFKILETTGTYFNDKIYGLFILERETINEPQQIEKEMD